MKNANFALILLSLALILGACNNDQNRKVPAYKKTSAKSIIIEAIPNNIITPEDRVPPEISYDEVGRVNMRKQWRYNPKGDPVSVNIFTYGYDENGNRIKETSEYYDLDGLLDLQVVNDFTYNDKDQQTDFYSHTYDRHLNLTNNQHTVMEYYETGLEKSVKTFNSKGIAMSKTIRFYEENGDLVAEAFEVYDEYGAFKEGKKLFYDKFGKVINEEDL